MLCICINTAHHCLFILHIFPPNVGVFVKLNVNRNSFRWNALPFIARGVYLNRGRPYCLQDISQVRHSSSFSHSPNNINSSTLCLHLPGCRASFLYRRPTPPPKSETAAVPDSQSYWCGWHSQGSPAVCNTHTHMYMSAQVRVLSVSFAQNSVWGRSTLSLWRGNQWSKHSKGNSRLTINTHSLLHTHIFLAFIQNVHPHMRCHFFNVKIRLI